MAAPVTALLKAESTRAAIPHCLQGGTAAPGPCWFKFPLHSHALSPLSLCALGPAFTFDEEQEHACSRQSPSAATSSVQHPGSLALFELYQDKLDRKETHIGEVSLMNSSPSIRASTCPAYPRLFPLGCPCLLAAAGCHPAPGCAVKQADKVTRLVRDVTKRDPSCGCDHLGLSKVGRLLWNACIL